MDLECPYCEAGLEVNHDDGFGYEEGVKHQMQCHHCNKNFVFETSISFYYEPEKADCLNDGNHDYEPTHTSPVEFTEMECSMCGDRRDLTNEERVALNIGTKEDYFKRINSPSNASN